MFERRAARLRRLDQFRILESGTLAAYDAFWCGMPARLRSGSNQIAEWKQYLALNAGMFFGATGRAQLNAHGDRAQGDFEFWTLRNVNGSAKWTSVATWQSGVFAWR